MLRADIQRVLDEWAALDRGEARRLAREPAVARIERFVDPEPVLWFQGVEWSLPLFSVERSRETEPDSGVLVLTAAALLLIGGRSSTTWPLHSIERFSYFKPQFVSGSPPHFTVVTPAGVQNLVLGRRAPQQPMLARAGEAVTRLGVPHALSASAVGALGVCGDAGALDAVIGELATLRDRGTITQAQFEAERRRLLG